MIGVAISTTGHEHRMRFLETCVEAWRRVLPLGSALFITVDGSEEDAHRVRHAVLGPNKFGTVWRVGQRRWGVEPYDGRLGVAVSKNTGLELLMDQTPVEHLFLCDDDTWPLYTHALTKHTEFPYPHSMVCWGTSRLVDTRHGGPGDYAEWNWPRGVVLHARREVVEAVGGMDERFGKGGHEHAEWSRRIHQAGFTPTPFLTPASYATRKGMGCAALWNAEDMRKPGEVGGMLDARRRRQTTIDPDRDWEIIHRIMAERDGDTSFVPFRAHENGRASATLSENLSSQGAEGESR